MNPLTRSVLKSFLGGVAWLFFALAGLAFWFGGGLIHAIFSTDRILSEMEGIALMLLFGGLGVGAKFAEDRLEEAEVGGPISLGNALRRKWTFPTEIVSFRLLFGSNFLISALTRNDILARSISAFISPPIRKANPDK